MIFLIGCEVPFHMIERRKHHRFIVEGMDIFARTIFNAPAEVIDISPTGASIRIPRRLNMGGVYALKFGHGGNYFTIKGTVIWEKLTGAREIARGEVMPIYTAGVEFQEVPADKSQQLRVLIAEKMKEIRERRLGGIRVRVTGDNHAVLSCLETSAVKDISLGGMRIETWHEILTDTAFRLEIVLKENESSLFCKGKVAFCHKKPWGAETEQYTVGIEFIEMSAGDGERLRRFVASLAPFANKPV
jgi:c-di-GMP-binding flagellar brake protein YcgR